MESFLVGTDIAFSYDGKPSIFSKISFGLQKGNLCALMGGNGSGKTTLLNCISGTLSVTSGNIHLNGTPIQSLSGRQRARLLGTVPQETSVIFPYRVRDVVMMGRAPYIGTFSMPGKQDRYYIEKAMDETGIRALEDELFSGISGGERQLVLIARALAQNTPALLLDEPTSHLDFKNQIKILCILKQLVKQNHLLAVMATHDPNHVLQFADTVMILHDGGFYRQGSPHEVISRESIKAVYEVDVDEIRSNDRIRGVLFQAEAA
ncbi:MAG: ABC transporter ATP-binding protein [Desulfobacterales bacterium]|nr:ABC transporter ATP-binding protein [Desulfobacterales bacterium]MDD4073141.1 ABC transporter ATP-binding protein [Desulfobacterales bacterium]MDD4393595.1 ABC transporter ATP-binding protein [Desulfobacterales bacterium]